MSSSIQSASRSKFYQNSEVLQVLQNYPLCSVYAFMRGRSAMASKWLAYDFPPEVREKLKHQWGSDWKGQAQKWFLLKFTGKDEEINLLGDGTEKAEFGEWSWISPEQKVELAVYFNKPVYKEVMIVFAPYLQ
ncbi:nudix hydrolase 26, chloroplastic-like [Quercus lobata]|uniref:nudix hydrolase 26, chloroplastic-like n=1 Tax=Quercus lobata TaxID=97700 RepID=UPI0012455981|nr:nudix hydrolase 26, chloroplastic-like [Quercus lobata]